MAAISDHIPGATHIMKQTHTTAIDIKGLQQAVTMLAIASGLAGWAVLARPAAPAPVAAVTQNSAAPLVQVAAPPVASSAPAAMSSAAAPAPSLPVAPVAAPSLRVVAPVQAPVTATRSSR
jgi:hypothetical protein